MGPRPPAAPIDSTSATTGVSRAKTQVETKLQQGDWPYGDGEHQPGAGAVSGRRQKGRAWPAARLVLRSSSGATRRASEACQAPGRVLVGRHSEKEDHAMQLR